MSVTQFLGQQGLVVIGSIPASYLGKEWHFVYLPDGPICYEEMMDWCHENGYRPGYLRVVEQEPVDRVYNHGRLVRTISRKGMVWLFGEVVPAIHFKLRFM